MGNEFIFSRLRKMKQDAAGSVNPQIKEPLVKLVEDLSDIILNQERVIHHILHVISRPSSLCYNTEESTNEELAVGEVGELKFSAPMAQSHSVNYPTKVSEKAKTRAPRKAKKQKATPGDV